MSRNIKQNRIMTVTSLIELLTKLKKEKEIGVDFQIWLSSDEEGNEFLPMLENPKLSLSIEKNKEKIILFPSHR